MNTKSEPKQGIDAVLADLRRAGYIARRNFRCCSNCAGYELAEMAHARHDKKPVQGVVFWHAQDEQDRKAHGEFNLRFGPVYVTEREAELGKPIDEIGREVALMLTKHGVHHQWSGNPNECITIFEGGVQ